MAASCSANCRETDAWVACHRGDTDLASCRIGLGEKVRTQCPERLLMELNGALKQGCILTRMPTSAVNEMVHLVNERLQHRTNTLGETIE